MLGGASTEPRDPGLVRRGRVRRAGVLGEAGPRALRVP